MNTRSLTVTLLTMLLLAPGLVAANPYAAQARIQLAQAARSLALYNYYQTHNPIIDYYYPRRGVETYTVRLQAGMNYAIIGTCDVDCTDMDLGLYNANGSLLVRDVARDDKPILTFRPQRSGTYYLKVAIPRCWASRCTFGLGVYGQG